MILNLQKRENTKIVYLLIGLASLYAGVGTLLEEPEFRMSVGFLHSDIFGAPVHNYVIGAAALLFSFTWMISAFFRFPEKELKRKQEIPPTHICISCGDFITQEGQHSFSCQKCEGEVESIAGVFNRHPDLIKNLKQKNHNKLFEKRRAKSARVSTQPFCVV
jgi:hypothetical protein